MGHRTFDFRVLVADDYDAESIADEIFENTDVAGIVQLVGGRTGKAYPDTSVMYRIGDPEVWHGDIVDPKPPTEKPKTDTEQAVPFSKAVAEAAVAFPE